MEKTTKQMISDKMKKTVFNTQTFEIKKGLKEICEDKGYTYNYFSNMLSGKKKNTSNYIYVNLLEFNSTKDLKSEKGVPFEILNLFLCQAYGGYSEKRALVLLEGEKYFLTAAQTEKYL